MKKLIILICVTAISTGISAQTDTRERDVKDQQEELDRYDQLDSEQVELKDGYIYRDGRMMTVKDGMTSVMKKETRLTNGTVLAINGDYTVTDGKPAKLKTNQHIDADGVITNYATPRDGKKG